LNSIKRVEQEEAIFGYINTSGIVPKNDVRELMGKITGGASRRVRRIQDNESGAANADSKRRPTVRIVV
jgi:hypothetical protein